MSLKEELLRQMTDIIKYIKNSIKGKNITDLLIREVQGNINTYEELLEKYIRNKEWFNVIEQRNQYPTKDYKTQKQFDEEGHIKYTSYINLVNTHKNNLKTILFNLEKKTSVITEEKYISSENKDFTHLTQQSYYHFELLTTIVGKIKEYKSEKINLLVKTIVANAYKYDIKICKHKGEVFSSVKFNNPISPNVIVTETDNVKKLSKLINSSCIPLIEKLLKEDLTLCKLVSESINKIELIL